MLTLFYERNKTKPKRKPQMGSPRKACDDKVVINLSAKCAQGIYFKPQIKTGSWAQLSINISRKEMLHGSESGILYSFCEQPLDLTKVPKSILQRKMQTFHDCLDIFETPILWFFGHITISKTIDLKCLNLYLHEIHCSILETKSEAFLYVK